LTRADRDAREDVVSQSYDAGSSTKAHDGPPCGPPAAQPEASGEGPPAPLDADPEQVLVEALARAVVECRADGREHAARVAWEALGALLAQPVVHAEETPDEGTVKLVLARRDR